MATSVCFASERLQFALVPPLVPLGSIGFQFAHNVIFAAFRLGSCLVPLGSSLPTYTFYNTVAWFRFVPLRAGSSF